MKNIIKKWADETDGATAIEYALLAAGIALTILATVFALGDDINGLFEAASSYID